MRDAIVIITPIVVAIIVSVIAPNIVERIKGTQTREQKRLEHEAVLEKTRLDKDLQALEEWREQRELIYLQMEEKYNKLQEKYTSLETEVRKLRKREEELTEISDQHSRANQLLDQQVTILRNENYRLMQKLSAMERHS